MLRILCTSTAALAVAASLTAPAMAQTAVPVVPAAPSVPAPAVPAPVAPAAAPDATSAPRSTPATETAPQPAAIPEALTALGVTDATSMPAKHGQRFSGSLPGGGQFQAAFDDSGALRMIRSVAAAAAPGAQPEANEEPEGGPEGDALRAPALPPAVLERLIPQPVRSAAIMSEIASVKGVMLPPDGRVMVFGTDAGNEMVRAAFDADGSLQRFGRGGEDRGPGGKDRKEGKPHKGPKGDHDGKKGPRGDREGDKGKGPKHGPEGDAKDPASVAETVTAAGYTQPGAVTQDGLRTLIEAVNADGQPVTLTIDGRGIIVREQAR